MLISAVSSASDHQNRPKPAQIVDYFGEKNTLYQVDLRQRLKARAMATASWDKRRRH
jgi:hypothetical protein